MPLLYIYIIYIYTHTFFPKVRAGYRVVQKPTDPIHLPVSLKTIRNFYTKLTDQDNHVLDLRGEHVTIRFHIREPEKLVFGRLMLADKSKQYIDNSQMLNELHLLRIQKDDHQVDC